MILKKLQQLKGGGIFVAATFFSQVFNFLFNAYLGRTLPYEQFALITLIVNIWYFILIILNALSFLMTNRTAYLEKHEGAGTLPEFYHFFTKRTLQISLATGIIWLLLTPVLVYFFHIHDWLSILMISPLIVAAAILSTNRGFLQGRMFFTEASIVLVTESVARFIYVYFLVREGLGAFSYWSIPAAIITALVVSYIFTRRHVPKPEKTSSHRFAHTLFIALILSGISTTAFLTVDMFMVKHYFSDRVAGMYALLVLTGKIIFFFCSLLNSVLFTYASQKGKNAYTMFYRILAAVAGLSIIAFFIFGVFGSFTIHILLGEKATAIFPYLLVYTAANCVFAFTNAFITFHIARDEKKISLVSFGMACILVIAIATFHASLFQIVYSFFTVSVIGWVIVIAGHIIQKKQYAI